MPKRKHEREKDEYLPEQYLQEFLNSNPEIYQVIAPPPSKLPQLYKTLSFYDSHVDERFALKSVVISSRLKGQLYEHIHRQQRLCENNSIPLPSPEDSEFPSQEVRKESKPFIRPTADNLSAEYSIQASQHCGTVASTLYFHHKLGEWKTVFDYEIVNTSQKYPFIVDNYGVTLGESVVPSDDDEPYLPQEIKDTIERAAQHSPAVAIVQVLDDSPAGEQVLKAMGAHTLVLPAHEPILSGFSPLSHTPNGDLENSSVVNELVQSLNATPQLSRKPKVALPKRMAKRRIDLSSVKILKSLASSKDRYIRRADLAGALIQRAWTRAVAANSSFMIFHNGKSERIGIRDRVKQRLYISDLIEINACSRPAYHGFHTGLYLAMLEDALERVRMHSKPLKIPKPLQVVQGQRRSRWPMIVDLRSRKFALLALQYKGFNSSSPSMLVRLPGNGSITKPEEGTDLKPSEYFLLTLVSEVAQGGTGVVHDAILEFSVPGGVQGKGSLRQIRVIVKLASMLKQRQRLQKEFRIYERLLGANVEGVPCTYGLFEDVETGMSAMVMDHTGESLAARYPGVYFNGQLDSPRVLAPLRDRLTKILTKIHEAGVFHRDIRPDNLTVDDRGDVYIIDFDRARLNPTETQKSIDLACLKRVLEGESDPGIITSSKTAPSSPSSISNVSLSLASGSEGDE